MSRAERLVRTPARRKVKYVHQNRRTVLLAGRGGEIKCLEEQIY